MEVSGVTIAMLDIPAGLTEEYNRWYDLDHLPEHVSKQDVLIGRRYVATRELRSAPGVQRSQWLGGYPPYLTNYWFGGPLDFMSDEALGLWRDKDRGITKSGRYWRVGSGKHNSRWRVVDAFATPSVLIDKAAVPYMAHRGVIVSVGKAKSSESLDAALSWWDATHLGDLFAVPGILAAVRLRPAEDGHSDMVSHLILCEHDPAQVMVAIDQAKRYWEALGRFPAHGGVYESMAFLPYQRIIPLEYDFDVTDPEDPEDEVPPGSTTAV